MRLAFVLWIVLCSGSAWASALHYALDIKLYPEQKRLSGVAEISGIEPVNISLSTAGLSNIIIDGQSITTNQSLSLDLNTDKVFRIQFQADLSNSNPANWIDPKNVILSTGWYPQPDRLTNYHLRISLPKGFVAISEADSTTASSSGKTQLFEFDFPHPRESISLVASTEYEIVRGRYKEIAIEAYFYPEHAHLAESYINRAKEYLAIYEAMLTPYPYRRFAIVENQMPIGYAMPTYTLLGKNVVPLPFIVTSSLGHELLHQWFGASVYHDVSQGNWAEGLTNYLADHHFLALKGQGSSYRKQILINWDAYVNDSTAIPLTQFQRRNNKVESAVGYGKSAMVFHQLRQVLGDTLFFDALRRFVSRYQYRYAGWKEIQSQFELVSGKELGVFFQQWLQRKDIPSIQVENISLRIVKGQLTLKFTLIQLTEPYRIRVPISVYSISGKNNYVIELVEQREDISLVLPEVPQKVVIDEDYNLMRRITANENPPVLARMIGAENVLVSVTHAERNKYSSLFKTLMTTDKYLLKEPDKVTFKDVKEHNVLILGSSNALTEMMFGTQAARNSGLELQMYRNPYNPKKLIAWARGQDLTEIELAAKKLGHYGKYSTLHFNQGRNTSKSIDSGESGIMVLESPLTKVVQPAKLSNFNEILQTLDETQVIYIGERHTEYVHHLNQLQVIKTIHESGQKLAIGMEIFEISQQKAIDEFLVGNIDEAQFLRDTDYFRRWNYDYNLYKPIIDYAKDHKIHIVALNLDNDIIHQVSKKGIDALSEDQRKQLPVQMDLSNPKYRKDLREVFANHNQYHGPKDFMYFLQAQVLWDETMAQTAHRYLRNHSSQKLVILAGNGHLRFRYGIPSRLFRRNQMPYKVFLQDDGIDVDIADYVLLSNPIQGRQTPKLGVLVKGSDNVLMITEVNPDTPAAHADLKKDDVIIGLNDFPISTLSDLRLALFYAAGEENSTIKIMRGGIKYTRDVRLGHRN